jgi:hypothetical protein
VPINTSSCIYHYLIKAPLSTWGENIIVLAQNLIIVCTCWSEQDCWMCLFFVEVL